MYCTLCSFYLVANLEKFVRIVFELLWFSGIPLEILSELLCTVLQCVLSN